MTASLCFAQGNSVGLPCYKILCSGILNIPLPYGMHLKVSPKEHPISLSNYIPKSTEAPWMWCAIVGADHSASLFYVFQGQVHKVVLWWYCFCCVKESFYGTAFNMWLPCRKRDVGANTSTRRVSWENRYSWTKKNSGSCRWVCWKTHVGQSSHDDVTVFSNRCCNVGGLVETAVWPLSFS